MDKVQAIIVAQNLTTGPQRVAFMRTVLKGDTYTYTYFNQYFTTVGNVMFILGVQALMSHIFPQRALHMQKRYCGITCVSHVI